VETVFFVRDFDTGPFTYAYSACVFFIRCGIPILRTVAGINYILRAYYNYYCRRSARSCGTKRVKRKPRGSDGEMRALVKNTYPLRASRVSNNITATRVVRVVPYGCSPDRNKVFIKKNKPALYSTRTGL